ncbi:HDOD domain-containing protein [Rhodoferax aquaticus]|uniref:HDOD domain-containing protein n=1 Tax=Rhodoferax aquaticus TaxID=2527691 RepID=A0A515EPC0_9BURK|nr:HDOD domain-containing protein [Rhodoferax aquaticus]QDL54514.1 HDOD domain-containing protein [Rhodoferax aquaticus]
MKVAEVEKELDHAKTQGPLRDIIIAPCPEALIELMREVQSGDPDPAVIARIAGSDVAMAASLLRIANSPVFARSRPASTVSEAVAILGLAHSIGILAGFITRKAMPVKSPLLEHFWETSTRRASAMEYIARQLYVVDAGTAQTCGLFCHIGMPVMMQGLKGYADTLATAMAEHDRSFTGIENAAHRTDHAVVGALVAKTWLLPPNITLAIRLHHDLTCLQDQRLPKEVRTLVAMALVAEHLVATHEGVPEQPEWEADGAHALAYLNVTRGEVEMWQDQLQPYFESSG